MFTLIVSFNLNSFFARFSGIIPIVTFNASTDVVCGKPAIIHRAGCMTADVTMTTSTEVLEFTRFLIISAQSRSYALRGYPQQATSRRHAVITVACWG